jgi:hypothetical protein
LLVREAGIRSRGFPPLDPRLRRGRSLKASASPPQSRTTCSFAAHEPARQTIRPA